MIYTSSSKYIQAVIKRGKGFRVFLDDTAQILGHEIKIVDESQIVAALKKNSAVLVADGYAATYGRSSREAQLAMEVLEKACYIYLAGDVLGGVKTLPYPDAKLMRSVYKKKYSKSEEGEEKAVTGNPLHDAEEREVELRNQIVEFGNRLVEEKLVSGTWGNLSIRLDEKYMLVTPSGISYNRLTAGDIVKVEIDTLEYEGNLKPTSEKGLHSQIYLNRKDVKAVIHTHQTYASVFAACKKKLEDIRIAKYALPGTKMLAKRTVKALGMNAGCIMAHHGMCAVGQSLNEAFENCIEIENMAKKYF